MSLLVWLPLIKDTKNQGVSNPTITTTGTLAYNAGKLGNALTFNNSAIVMNPAPLNTNTKEFSFAFWFKTTNTGASQCLYNGRTAVGEAVSLFFIGGNTWRFDDGAQHTLTPGVVVNEWHHYAFTRNETNIKYYVDGVLKQTVSSTAFTCTATYASLGMSTVNTASPAGNSLIGQVNDYRIYNHVLSVREIKELSKGLMTHLPLSWGANPNLAYRSDGKHYFDYTTITTQKGILFWQSELMSLESGVDYTVSFDAKIDTTTDNLYNGLECDLFPDQLPQRNFQFTADDGVTNQWKHFTWTTSSTNSNIMSCRLRFFIDFADSVTGNTVNAPLHVKNIKIEKGTIDTPYIPHINETAYSTYNFANKYYQDCSGYNRNVTTSGTLTIGTGSPRGTGTDFNKAKITVSDGFPVGTQSPFTIAYWHKAKTGTYTTWCDSIGFDVGNSSSTAASTQLRREAMSTTGNNYGWYGNGVVTNSSGMLGYTQTLDTWYHVVYTFDGTTFKQYINGTQQATATLGSDYTGFKTYPRFYIGDTGNLFEQCADVRVYATCLSADDIKALYQIPAEIDKLGNMYCGEFVEE